MARRPEFKIKKLSTGKWQLNVPASVTASGKRERLTFPSRDKAKVHASKVRAEFLEHGSNAQTIPPSLAIDAAKAIEYLEPWDTTLTEAARFYAQEMERRNASKSAIEACREWFELRESDSRQSTVQNYKRVLKTVEKAFGETSLALIETRHLQEIISPPGTTYHTASSNHRNHRAFWNWAAKKGWCKADVIQGVEIPKKPESGEIEILAVDEARRLLETAQRYFPQAVATYAVQLFAGVRPEEARKLDGKHFSDEGIQLPPEVTKKGRRRHINPNETLSAWLKKYPFKPCPNWKRVNDACRHLAGWNVAADEKFIKGMERLPLLNKAWPHDGLRRSHASYAVASGVELERLLWEFGHTGSHAVLREHYVGRASKKDALAFFEIVPKGSKKPRSIAVA